MQKPDIAELRRLSLIRPVSIVHELCDYIDSLSELDTERRLAWYRNLRTKIQDCPLEDSPVTGHFWRKNEPEKVAQIRKFVDLKSQSCIWGTEISHTLQDILDFIDSLDTEVTVTDLGQGVSP